MTGNFPSSSFPLDVPDAYPDLLSSTFNTQIASSATFGWFNRAGQRLSNTGDADLTAAKIRSGKAIFGATGTYSIPDVWNVRRNTTIDTALVGKVKTNCRNLTNLAIWQNEAPRFATGTAADDLIHLTAHGFSNGDKIRITFGHDTVDTEIAVSSDVADLYVINATTDTFQYSYSPGGAANDFEYDATELGVAKMGSGTGEFSTIDAANNNAASMTSGNPWGNSDHNCLGTEATTGDDNIWKDVTVGGCTSSSVDCIYMDKISKTQWSRNQGSMSPMRGIAVCDQLVYGGYSDWRLPSIFELSVAVNHGFYGTASSNWIPRTSMLTVKYWSSTKDSSTELKQWKLDAVTGEYTQEWFGSNAEIICARN